MFMIQNLADDQSPFLFLTTQYETEVTLQKLVKHGAIIKTPQPESTHQNLPGSTICNKKSLRRQGLLSPNCANFLHLTQTIKYVEGKLARFVEPRSRQ